MKHSGAQTERALAPGGGSRGAGEKNSQTYNAGHYRERSVAPLFGLDCCKARAKPGPSGSVFRRETCADIKRKRACKVFTRVSFSRAKV
jgi:hypothetical protein